MGTAPNGYNTPKTNWAAGNVPTASDFNRIEGNIYAIEEGSRTIDPTQVPASNQGTLRQFLDWFANRIKAITGKTNWYDAPSKTLEDLNSHINAPAPHSGHALVSDLTAHASNITHIPYAVVTGSANAYSVSISGITTYQEGLAIAVKINVDNTGASTININGLGAKSIKKPNGNDVAAGNLKAGSVYTLRFNGTNFILQGSDSAGNATPADVLAGKTFSNDNGPDQVGTMPNNGNLFVTPSGNVQTFGAGYYAGITVNAVSVSAGDSPILTLNATGYSTTSTFTQIVKNVKLIGNGSIRVKFDLYCPHTNPVTVFGIIIKNSVALQTFYTNSNTPVTFSYDVSFSSNDTISLGISTSNAAYYVYASNFRLCASVPYVEVIPS